MDQRLVIRELREPDIAAAQEVMRSVIEDSAEAYDPVIHADVEDLRGSYLRRQGAFMLVVEDTTSGEVLATGGLRNGAFDPDEVPPQLALLERRYRDGGTGQVTRVHVLPQHRRCGIARALVEAIIDRARAEAQYVRLALHTHPYSPGALTFWLAMGFQEVLDDMEASHQIFLELPLSTERNRPVLPGTA
ncbi:GNAT family N-acetyltransferase [Terrabacter sp. GCM10028922]|uniref:GNAT family N-acetyltransferase n=1 Tax=Terrabacter sp. GCM10028922 TaxID=3273428 RepID=UPI00360AC7D4